MVVIFAAAALCMIVERLMPARPLPPSPGWWLRVVALNVVQFLVVVGIGTHFDGWFRARAPLPLPTMHPAAATAIAYVAVTFVFYFWHRARHGSAFLWNVFHQVHHSPVRIETVTSFYKHPLEILVNAAIVSAVVYGVLGADAVVGGRVTVVTAIAEMLYHMNVRTPRAWGYVFQRPEMHRIHHERGKHRSNFADLPVWDMLFGTYVNPRESDVVCGFAPPREERLADMLVGRNVNGPIRGQDR